MTMNESDIYMMENRRLRRAQFLFAAVFAEIQDVLRSYDPIKDDLDGELYDRLLHVFMENGAYIMTDKDRAEMGLEPFDKKGWTPSEKVAEKRRREEAMLACLKIPLIQTQKDPLHQ